MSNVNGSAAVVHFGAVTDTYDLSSFNLKAPPLGTIWPITDADGTVRKYRFVKNTSASTIATAIAVAPVVDQNNVNNVVIAPASVSGARVRGVTVASLPVNYGGWVQYHGPVTVTADASTAITKNTGIRIGTGASAGRFQSVADATIPFVGISLGANITADATGTAFLLLPD